MKTPNADRARILVHALPYIKKYNGKIVVIKYGGNAMINEKLKDSVMRDIVLLSLIGVRVVLVHGGGPEITELLSKMGKKPSLWTVCGSPTGKPLRWRRWFSPEKSIKAL